MINFKLAELRKKHGITQQELGDILCVSYQTISKWENGIVYPDITMLPRISGYFGVSVDALLGLEPLDDSYTPSNSGKAEYWEERLEYLKRTRKTMWNEDYIRFLVRDVWKINRPITILDYIFEEWNMINYVGMKDLVNCGRQSWSDRIGIIPLQ